MDDLSSRFLGSGPVFFAVAPEAALLGDLNDGLIEVYEQVAHHSARIEEALAALTGRQANVLRG